MPQRIVLFPGGLVSRPLWFNLYDEFRASYTKYSSAGFDLHGIWGTVGDMARDHGERPTFNRSQKFPFLRGGVEIEFLQDKVTIGSSTANRGLRTSVQ
jgi:hypothetical protein